MDTATETTVYERTLKIAAGPETVWEFFVDPEKLMRWKGVEAELDPEAAHLHLAVDPPEGVLKNARKFGYARSDSTPSPSTTSSIA